MLERIVRTTVEEGGAGPLCDYLCRRFTYHSPETWRGLLEEGRVLLDGAVASGGETLTAGMEIQYMPRPVPEPEVSFDAKLLFQDDAYIVIDKPANLPCHPAGCFFNNTLWAALKQGMVDGLPPMDEIHFVSRLDRETSGIVLLAKTSADAWKLSTSCDLDVE